MRITSKVLAILLVVLLGLSMAACNQATSNGAAGTNQEVEAAETNGNGVENGGDVVEGEELIEENGAEKAASEIVAFQSQDIFEKVIMDADPQYFLIDLRNRNDFLDASIAGAISIPYDVCDKEEVISRMPLDKKIVIIDYNGKLSAQIADTWHELGLDVGFLVNGMDGWLISESGEKYPTVKTELSTAASSGCS